MTFPSQVPDAGTPIFNSGGYINPVWHQFFFTLLNRTGGIEGASPVTDVTGAAPITSTGGVEPEIGITAASPLAAGSMSGQDKAKLDSVTAGAAVAAVTGSAPIASSGGTSPDISITPASTLAAGSMSSADKSKLDGITPGAGVVSVGATAPITSSGGSTPTIAINAATPGLPGSMSAADKTKLDTMTANAAVASVSGTAPIVSSGGTTPAISISAATPGTAGSLSAADKTRIDALSAASSPTFQALTLTNGQVVFPAVQVPSANANTLDDYEEGSFTITLTAATPGDLTVTYSVRVADYTKIGRMVFVTFVISLSAFTWTTATGDLILTGLPFANAGVSQISGCLDWRGITKAGFTQMSPVVVNGASQLLVLASGSGAARTTVKITDMPSAGTVFLSGQISYFV